MAVMVTVPVLSRVVYSDNVTVFMVSPATLYSFVALIFACRETKIYSPVIFAGTFEGVDPPEPVEPPGVVDPPEPVEPFESTVKDFSFWQETMANAINSTAILARLVFMCVG